MKKTIKTSKHATVYDIGKEAHSFMDADKCADLILDKASSELGAEIGSVMLLDPKKNELFVKKAIGMDKHVQKLARVKMGEGIAGWVAKRGEPVLIKNISKDKRFKGYGRKTSARYKTDSLLSVPLKIDDKVIGVINVTDKKAKKHFTMQDLKLLSFIAEETALAIKNAVTYEEAKRLAGIKLDFISNVSHELKNPLAIVRDSVMLLSDSLGSTIDEPKRRAFSIAVSNIDRLNRMLTDILDLARLEAGRADIHRNYIDIKELVSESVEFIRPTARAKGISICVNSAVKFSKIWADRDRLCQVINNLLTNAVKFTPRKGRVNILVNEKDSKVLVSVQDTGPGIKSQDMPKLFNKFERFGPSRTRTEGTGLGLAISKEIVDIHRGKIWAESRPGKGTKFIIMLPKDLRKEERYA